MNFFKKYLKTRRTRHFYKELIVSMEIKTVFDIGANTGAKSQLFLRNNCKVLALEPNPDCFKDLNRLKKNHKELILLQKGLLAYNGKAKLNLSNISEVATFSNKFIEEFTVENKVYWNETKEVEVITVSDLINQYGLPDFIKLDCEGMDYSIIHSFGKPIRLVEFEYTKPFKSETISSILHIASLGDYEFNFSPYENSKFLFKKWLRCDLFLSRLTIPLGKIIHGNVYCRLTKTA